MSAFVFNISNIQNELSHSFISTISCYKIVLEKNHKFKKIIDPFSQNVHFWIWGHFLLPFFVSIRFMFLIKQFFLLATVAMRTEKCLFLFHCFTRNIPLPCCCFCRWLNICDQWSLKDQLGSLEILLRWSITKKCKTFNTLEDICKWVIFF